MGIKSGFDKLMSMGRGLGTAAVILPTMGLFLVHGVLIKLVTRNRILRRRRLIQNVQNYSRFALRVMRVQVHLQQTKALSSQNYLMVSNHMSYLDMLALASLFPAVFVTSVDMGKVIFLGQMAEIGGSLFIERRHRERISQDIEQIQSVLSQGFHVMLFPEGTSTDGSSVLPFKKSLLMAAAQADCPILPVTLKYREIEGEVFSAKNHQVVCWYGKKDFVTHFLRLLSAKSVVAEVSLLEPMKFKSEEEKHQVGDQLHRVISENYQAQFKNLQGGRIYDGDGRSQKLDSNISRGPRENTYLAKSP